MNEKRIFSEPARQAKQRSSIFLGEPVMEVQNFNSRLKAQLEPWLEKKLGARAKSFMDQLKEYLGWGNPDVEHSPFDTIRVALDMSVWGFDEQSPEAIEAAEGIVQDEIVFYTAFRQFLNQGLHSSKQAIPEYQGDDLSSFQLGRYVMATISNQFKIYAEGLAEASQLGSVEEITSDQQVDPIEMKHRMLGHFGYDHLENPDIDESELFWEILLNKIVEESGVEISEIDSFEQFCFYLGKELVKEVQEKKDHESSSLGRLEEKLRILFNPSAILVDSGVAASIDMWQKRIENGYFEALVSPEKIKELKRLRVMDGAWVRLSSADIEIITNGTNFNRNREELESIRQQFENGEVGIEEVAKLEEEIIMRIRRATELLFTTNLFKYKEDKPFLGEDDEELFNCVRITALGGVLSEMSGLQDVYFGGIPEHSLNFFKVSDGRIICRDMQGKKYDGEVGEGAEWDLHHKQVDEQGHGTYWISHPEVQDGKLTGIDFYSIERGYASQSAHWMAGIDLFYAVPFAEYLKLRFPNRMDTMVLSSNVYNLLAVSSIESDDNKKSIDYLKKSFSLQEKTLLYYDSDLSEVIKLGRMLYDETNDSQYRDRCLKLYEKKLKYGKGKVSFEDSSNFLNYYEEKIEEAKEKKDEIAVYDDYRFAIDYFRKVISILYEKISQGEVTAEEARKEEDLEKYYDILFGLSQEHLGICESFLDEAMRRLDGLKYDDESIVAVLLEISESYDEVISESDQLLREIEASLDLHEQGDYEPTQVERYKQYRDEFEEQLGSFQKKKSQSLSVLAKAKSEAIRH